MWSLIKTFIGWYFEEASSGRDRTNDGIAIQL